MNSSEDSLTTAHGIVTTMRRWSYAAPYHWAHPSIAIPCGCSAFRAHENIQLLYVSVELLIVLITNMVDSREKLQVNGKFETARHGLRTRAQ